MLSGAVSVISPIGARCHRTASKKRMNVFTAPTARCTSRRSRSSGVMVCDRTVISPARVKLSTARLTRLAVDAGFELVGFARADAIPAEHLSGWLEAGFAAD